jgi:membrane protease YdiL (CAAX protease family)
MTITKSIIATVLFILFTGLIGMWEVLELSMDISVLTNNYYILISGLIEILLITLFFIKLFGIKNLIPQKTQITYYLLAFLLGSCYTFIQTPLNFIYDLIFSSDHDIIYDFDMKRILTFNSFSVILLIPISEELFFRHYIQKGLQVNYTPYIAIGLTSLLFALIHLPYDALLFHSLTFDIHKAYIALFGGLFAGLLYYKSKSIGPSMMFHITLNLMATLT